MRLEVGEKWHRDEGAYVEELTVEGLESIEKPMAIGEEFLPRNGESEIKVRIINNVSEKFFPTTIQLRVLNENWTRGEADL